MSERLTQIADNVQVNFENGIETIKVPLTETWMYNRFIVAAKRGTREAVIAWLNSEFVIHGEFAAGQPLFIDPHRVCALKVLQLPQHIALIIETRQAGRALEEIISKVAPYESLIVGQLQNGDIEFRALSTSRASTYRDEGEFDSLGRISARALKLKGADTDTEEIEYGKERATIS